jgi:hypothetical protein
MVTALRIASTRCSMVARRLGKRIVADCGARAAKGIDKSDLDGSLPTPDLIGKASRRLQAGMPLS